MREGLHVAGAFAYELGYALEESLAPRAWPEASTPLISLGLFERRRVLVGDEIEHWLGGQSSDLRTQTKNRPGRAFPGHASGHNDKARCVPGDESNRPGAGEMGGRDKPGHDELDWRAEVTPRWDFARYATAFARVHDYISAGDVYQVNLTFPLDVEIEGDVIALYRDLRRNARSGYGAFMALPDATILSLSPELFFEIENGIIRTRPMKGTVARPPTYADDRKVAAALAQDEKQCAENLMIVDLLRNDLSRIAERGSVEVEDLFTVETYPTLHTMTSGIRANLRPEVSLSDILRAVFPCGSVTGAPKIRAMEIIRELETSPRGVYCGALGWFSGRNARLNVAIRTLEIRDGKARLNVGGGLVYDSQARDEYDEALLKARFLTEPAPPFSLIETMRLDRGGIWLLDRHLNRLAESAAYFQFPFDEPAIRSALDNAVSALRIESPDALTRLPPPLTPPRKGEGNVGHRQEAAMNRHLPTLTDTAHQFPSPLRGGVRGGGKRVSASKNSFEQNERGVGISDIRANHPTVYRLRLLLDSDGKANVMATLIPRAEPHPPMPAGDARLLHPQTEEITVAISPIRTNSVDRYLHHKTTRREIYDREFDRAAKLGCGEILFLNERGELTEGSRTTLFIAKNGSLVTPPLSSGCLAGCLRAELIARATPPVIERVFTPDDLATADAIYVGNSVRGLMRVRVLN